MGVCFRLCRQIANKAALFKEGTHSRFHLTIDAGSLGKIAVATSWAHGFLHAKYGVLVRKSPHSSIGIDQTQSGKYEASAVAEPAFFSISQGICLDNLFNRKASDMPFTISELHPSRERVYLPL